MRVIVGQRSQNRRMAMKSFLSSARPADSILSHWYSLFESGQFSSSAFYDSIEAELQARRLPRLRSSRPEFHEGGVASDKRVYLRLERELYAFDVCAAPFGTGYFFSLRLVEKPRSYARLIACLAVLLVLSRLLTILSGQFEQGSLVFYVFGVLALGVYLVVRMMKSDARPPTPLESGGGFDLDAFILNTAWIGDIYERTRVDTYYRYDTRLLFETIIADVVKRKVAELTSQNGVSLVGGYEYTPFVGGAYQAVKIGKSAQ